MSRQVLWRMEMYLNENVSEADAKSLTYDRGMQYFRESGHKYMEQMNVSVTRVLKTDEWFCQASTWCERKQERLA
jgi:hypothetical protein